MSAGIMQSDGTICRTKNCSRHALVKQSDFSTVQLIVKEIEIGYMEITPQMIAARFWKKRTNTSEWELKKMYMLMSDEEIVATYYKLKTKIDRKNLRSW